MFSVKTEGSSKSTDDFLKNISKNSLFSDLSKYGQMGVDALSKATPVDSMLTSTSWGYRINRKRNGYGIVWYNNNIVSGVNIAIILQYGHGTGTGGYVSGQDYINPAIRPVFDKILDEISRRVKNG